MNAGSSSNRRANEKRLQDATSELAALARCFAGRYLVRLDSLKPEPADEAFDRLKDAARRFVLPTGVLNRAHESVLRRKASPRALLFFFRERRVYGGNCRP